MTLIPSLGALQINDNSSLSTFPPGAGSQSQKIRAGITAHKNIQNTTEMLQPNTSM